MEKYDKRRKSWYSSESEEEDTKIMKKLKRLEKKIRKRREKRRDRGKFFKIYHGIETMMADYHPLIKTKQGGTATRVGPTHAGSYVSRSLQLLAAHVGA